ncbi:hypothetical protein [Bacillus pinisoli]|uniref:hypothetical protein n=1 Tax=Bacillus pinisoli TaxID=2901866 RepID=UPI001FF6D459|nr:hypothetical protein [Bacillus pinisoli]
MYIFSKGIFTKATIYAKRAFDLDATFSKDSREMVESPEFEKIIDAEFKGFGKAEWMSK